MFAEHFIYERASHISWSTRPLRFFYQRLMLAALIGSASPAPARAQTHALTLDSVLTRVTMQHPLIAASAYRVEAARGVRTTARAFGNPMLSWQEENGPFPGRAPSNAMSREISTFVTVPLASVYQRRPRARQADELVNAAGAELRVTAQRVALDAARSFYRLAFAQRALVASSDVQLWLDSLVRYTRVRVREGAAAEVDLLRLQVERDAAATEVALGHIEVARADAMLAAFVKIDSINAVSADSADIPLVFPALEQVIEMARFLRADLAAAQSRIAASRASRAFEQSAVIREASGMIGEKSTAGARSFIAGIMIPVPLFDQNRGEIYRATSELRAQQQEAIWMERQIVAEVAGALEAARTLSQQMRTLQAGYLRRAEDARAITLGAYQEGAVPLMQVLDASRTLAVARQLFYRTLFAQRLSMLELHAVIGADNIANMPTMSDALARAAQSLRKERP